MITLGLTGGIGMGKSAVTKYLLSKNIPVFDTDKAVADLYEPNSGIWYLHGRQFRQTIQTESKHLARDWVLADPNAIHALGAAAQPWLLKQATTFIADMKRLHKPIAVLDVPLLFESKWDKLLKLDVTATVSCNFENQAERVMGRSGMTWRTFNLMLANQLTDDERRERATFIIDTNGCIESTPPQVDAVLLLAQNYQLHR